MRRACLRHPLVATLEVKQKGLRFTSDVVTERQRRNVLDGTASANFSVIGIPSPKTVGESRPLMVRRKGPGSLPSDDDPVSLQPARDFAARQSASWMRCKGRESVMERLDTRYPHLFHDVQQPQHPVTLHVLATCQLP
jgi:hypothetical protein